MDYQQYEQIEKNLRYIASMRPVFNKRALFSDMTADYISPQEPEPFSKVKIRFRSAINNVDYVLFVHNNEKLLMSKASQDEQFDYYEIEVALDDQKYEYYFEIHVGKVYCFFDLRGVTRDVQDYYKFTLIPGQKVPAWAKGAVMYQIYIDRFYNGDPDNDVLTDEYTYIGEHVNRVTDWGKYPAVMGVREFYGGDLAGVLQKMDYLQDLGVDVIYFNPLFVSPSNHKYDIQDYDNIDPHIGKIVDDRGDLLQPGQMENRYATKYINRVANKKNLDASNELFAQVVEEAHKRGMKVILDGVFNHCGSFNKWMDRERVYENFEGYPKGAYVSADSPYRDYFHFYDPNQWPYNGSYDGWWGHDTLPKLNYEGSRELYDYVLHIGQKWVSPPYNADGWRLDVAADLGHSPEMNHRFWKDFRNAVRQANPNAIVLAEHYGSPKEWIENCEWDTVMNYDAFMEPVTWFLTGMEKHSDEFRGDLLGNPDAFTGALRHHMSRFNQNSLEIAMNELSNHDHSRFLTRTNRRVGRIHTMGPEAAGENINKGVFREAVVFQMTWPGAPTIYYGDEAGLCGWTDPDNRRGYPWGREDQELIQFHRDIIKVHKDSAALMKGSVMFLHGEYKVVSYGRFLPGEAVVVILNNDYEPHELNLHVRRLGVQDGAVMKACITTTESGYQMDETEYVVANNKLKITVGPISAVVLKYTEPSV